MFSGDTLKKVSSQQAISGLLLDQKLDLTIIHISKSIIARRMKILPKILDFIA